MNLTTENFKLIGAKCYRNIIFLDEEFEQDLSLIKRIIGKINKFSETGKFSTRLVYNNFIIATNCFGSEFVIKSLFLFCPSKNYDLLFTFLQTVWGVKWKKIIVNKDLIIEPSSLKINENFQKLILRDLKI